MSDAIDIDTLRFREGAAFFVVRTDLLSGTSKLTVLIGQDERL